MDVPDCTQVLAERVRERPEAERMALPVEKAQNLPVHVREPEAVDPGVIERPRGKFRGDRDLAGALRLDLRLVASPANVKEKVPRRPT